MATQSKKSNGQRQLAWVFDLNKCIGCQTCSVACKVLWTEDDSLTLMFRCPASFTTRTSSPFSIPLALASSGFRKMKGSPRWVLRMMLLVMFMEWMLQRGWPLVIRNCRSPPWLGFSLCTGSSSPPSRNQSWSM